MSEQVSTWISKKLGKSYPWPGNIRELEQCIRNIIVHGEYLPLKTLPKREPIDRISQEFISGTMTASQMLSKYCTLVYHQTGQYQETARRLDLDRRTVKGHIDEALLREF